ncbi:MAG: 30S ribosomal protein S2 [Candidatus Pacebacteria bacterium]|nr:30S ribosomal protein S2 [Candidatus Paceibacterota bacterium]PIR60049.1 MAG: 30S ribosomal protein S2 [Candidatus Pacebacteria bacterium CG10_big_fil_rev_8_21_14_0_10_44_54]
MKSFFADLPDVAPDYSLEEMLEAGCHFGHQKVKWNPRMAEWIHSEKDGVHIFDLIKTKQQLQTAHNAAYKLGQEGKTLVIVGTKRQARELVVKAAQESGALYIFSRWLGGLLTNWDQVKLSLKRMLKVEKGLADGSYKNYTKYEQVQLEKELARLRRFFFGIQTLKEQPDCLFVVDTVREHIAVKEANNVGIPVIGVCDSNANPDDVTICIPANDDAQKSLELIVHAVTAGYAAGKKAKKTPAAKPKAAADSVKATETK